MQEAATNEKRNGEVSSQQNINIMSCQEEDEKVDSILSVLEKGKFFYNKMK